MERKKKTGPGPITTSKSPTRTQDAKNTGQFAARISNYRTAHTHRLRLTEKSVAWDIAKPFLFILLLNVDLPATELAYHVQAKFQWRLNEQKKLNFVWVEKGGCLGIVLQNASLVQDSNICSMLYSFIARGIHLLNSSTEYNSWRALFESLDIGNSTTLTPLDRKSVV